MFASFWITLTRDDEDQDVLVEYEAIKAFGDIDINLTSVTIDGAEIETSEAEDKAILDACFDRVDEDWAAEQDAYGDYRYEMSRDDF